MQQIDHQRRAGHGEKKHRLIAAVDHAMARVERHGEQAALLPFEMHFALVVAGGPNFRGAEAADDVNQFFVEMIFRIERAAGQEFHRRTCR